MVARIVYAPLRHIV